MQIEQYQARKQRAETELADVEQQAKTEQENLSTARSVLEQSIDKMEADSQQREALIAERDECRATLDKAH